MLCKHYLNTAMASAVDAYSVVKGPKYFLGIIAGDIWELIY